MENNENDFQLKPQFTPFGIVSLQLRQESVLSERLYCREPKALMHRSPQDMLTYSFSYISSQTSKTVNLKYTVLNGFYLIMITPLKWHNSLNYSTSPCAMQIFNKGIVIARGQANLRGIVENPKRRSKWESFFMLVSPHAEFLFSIKASQKTLKHATQSGWVTF